MFINKYFETKIIGYKNQKYSFFSALLFLLILTMQSKVTSAQEQHNSKTSESSKSNPEVSSSILPESSTTKETTTSTNNNSQQLKLIEDYLNQAENITASFTQKSISGIAKGKFLFKKEPNKPSKIYIEYQDQPKIRIIINNNILSYQDLELKEISYLNINDSPAVFFANKKISFSSPKFWVKEIKNQPLKIDNQANITKTTISLIRKNDQEFAKFELIFLIDNENNVQLSGINAVNQNNELTQFVLNDIDSKTKIPNKTFTIAKKLTTE